MKLAVIAAALAIAAFRPVLLFREFNPHVEASYEAAAHILVGYLLGLWALNKENAVFRRYADGTDKLKPWIMRTFWALTAVEVVCAGIKIAMR